MSKRISLIFLLSAFILRVSAVVYTIQTVPDPKQFGQDYYVSNPDGVLQPYTVDALNQKATELDKMVEVELCVVAINSFDEDKYAGAYSFSLELFNTWGIGKAEKNTGVLVFLAKESRDIQIITGGGMEGLLPDITCGQIIDDNISYLSEGNFDDGLIAIAQGIEDHLLTDAAKAELLLGWKAKEQDNTTYNYLIFAMIALICLTVLAYKRLNGKPGESKAQLISSSAGTQTAIGCLAWIFPFPLLFLYLYYRYARKGIRKRPIPCPDCKTTMKLIPNAAEAGYLTPQQLAEVSLKSMEYDVWECPDCKRIQVLSYKGKLASKYAECPSCGARTYQTTSSETISSPTYSSSGLRKDHKVCAHCGFAGIVSVTLPKLVRSTSSSGGSYGGGGRSSGSWGGGHSFGGGAGRKF